MKRPSQHVPRTSAKTSVATRRRLLALAVLLVGAVTALMLYRRDGEPKQPVVVTTPDAHDHAADDEHAHASAAEPVAGAMESTTQAAPTERYPDTPTFRREFNQRKASMTRDALKNIEDMTNYPLWAGPLGENMRYQPPAPFHSESRGRDGAQPILEGWPEKLDYAPGEPIRIIARAHHDGRPVPIDSITGQTRSGMRPRPHVPLKFEAQKDGTMVATLDVPLEIAQLHRGEWTYVVEGKVEGVDRGLANHFRIMATDAEVTGPYRAAIEDGSLAVYVTIKAARASRQHLKGELWSAKGEPISYAWVRNDETPAGASTMRLLFYGKVIHDSRVNGPYEIRNLLLTTFDDNNDRIVNPAVDPKLKTEAFSYQQFTDVPINAGNAILAEKKAILEEELAHAERGEYDPNNPIAPRATKVPKDSPPPQ